MTQPHPDNAADAPQQSCALCGEPMDASETAVAVRRADGAPGLVHPACYPTYSAQERAKGNAKVAESPLRDLVPPPDRSAGA
ncbi:MAG TPA: hypothetical protein VF761_01970 [Gemmatimonadaceae bacterium]